MLKEQMPMPDVMSYHLKTIVMLKHSIRSHKGKQLNRLPAMTGSSVHSFGMPEEDADTKLKETSGKTCDLKDAFTGDIVEQDDYRTKNTKRKKKVKKVPRDRTTQSLDEQVNQVAREDMEGVNASIQEDLFQGGSAIDTPIETVAKVQQKGKKASKSRAPKIQEANHSTHRAKDRQDENAIGITGTHDNANASGYPTELPKKVPTDRTTQSLDEQVNQVAREDMEGVNASIQEDLVQGDSVIDTPIMETVAKVQQKGKRASKSQACKIQGANHSTHRAKDSQDENAISITGIYDNANASGYPTELPMVQKDSAPLKSPSPKARKERKKPLKTQSRDSAMEHDPSADLVRCSAEKDLVSPKNSADAVEANDFYVAHPASGKINFIEHFDSGKMNDRLVSAGNIQNNEDEIMEAKNKKNNTCSTNPKDVLESLLPAGKTRLTDHIGSSEVALPSAKADNMNMEYDNVKSGKEKRKKKRKANSEGPATDKENLDGDHQGTVVGTQNSLHSVLQDGRMGQDNGNENNNKVTHDVSIMQHEPEDGAFDRTVEKRLHRRDINSQNNLPINTVNAKTSKELRKSTSQKKAPVSNIVKSFAPSPAASSESTEGTPQFANRFRLAVRKVPKKRYEHADAKSKKETRKLGSGTIFDGAINEEFVDAMETKDENAALETPPNNSSASANSGISSTAYESDVPDDDEALSLSQKSLRGDLQIGSLLRGSSSYKKAKQKQAELLDDDTVVPDSQPADDLWG